MDRDTPLPARRVARGTVIAQARDWPTTPVTPTSPALAVMTDLTKVKAAITTPSTTLAQAEQTMINQGVRMLFVSSRVPEIDGLITTTDLHDEKRIRAVQQKKLRYAELRVADVMTALPALDAIDYESVRSATVSNVIATLKRLGRNHLLVVETPDGQTPPRVRGVLSKAQIERQLGAALDVFEVETGIAHLVQLAP